jgi:hypothetical protein
VRTADHEAKFSSVLEYEEALASDYRAAAATIQRIFESAWGFVGDMTLVSRQQQEALEKLQRLAWATLEAARLAPTSATATLRNEQGKAGTCGLLARWVQRALYLHQYGQSRGEAEWLTREGLLTLPDYRVPVAPERVLALLDSWGGGLKPPKGRRALSGIVAELGLMSGVLRAVGGESKKTALARWTKSTSEALKRLRIENECRLNDRSLPGPFPHEFEAGVHDGSIPGRSFAVAVEPLTFGNSSRGKRTR